MEQYTRIEDLVISGLETNHYYARITARDKEGDKLLLEQQVIKVFNDKDIPLDSKYIAACHTIPQKQKNIHYQIFE